MGVWIHTSHVIINVAIPIKILNTETLIKQSCLWEFSLHMWLSICKMLYAIFIYFYINLLCLFGEGNGNPLQCSCLENSRDGGAWWAAVYGVAESQTRLSDFPFTFHFHALKKEMATHSSVLAWRIPGTVEPGGLPSMGLHRVGHDWSDLAAAEYIHEIWFVVLLFVVCLPSRGIVPDTLHTAAVK